MGNTGDANGESYLCGILAVHVKPAGSNILTDRLNL